MNYNAFKSLIEKKKDATPMEKKLMMEEEFISSLSRVITKITKNIEFASKQANILINSLLRRYRLMVDMQAKEAQTNKKLFMQLLKQKMRDNFKTLDKNLNKFQVRNTLRKKTSKTNQTSVKSSLKKFSSLWSETRIRSTLFLGPSASWTTESSTRKSSVNLTRSSSTESPEQVLVVYFLFWAGIVFLGCEDWRSFELYFYLNFIGIS